MKLIERLRQQAVPLVVPGWVADQQLTGFHRHAEHVINLINDHTEMPILKIDNISDYYYNGTDQEYWDLTKDFPNLAPPWPMFWSEHRLVCKIHSTQGDVDLSDQLPIGSDARHGALFLCARPDQVSGSGLPDNAKWFLLTEQFTFYDLGRPDIEGPVGTFVLAIDEQGQMIGSPVMQTFAERATDPLTNQILQANLGMLHPSLLAISFMHCKNVHVSEHTTPAKLAKRTMERRGYTPTSWKELVIEPLKQILRKEGGADKHGIAKAMHICRGHFAHYGEQYGKGKLFGKLEGRYWMSSTVRGTRGEAPKKQREVTFKI